MQNDSQLEISPLEAARLRSGLSVQALSHVTGISRSTLQRRLDHPETASLTEVSAIAEATATHAPDLARAVMAGETYAAELLVAKAA
ncbi:hypothetical protein [uncultured Microbacterium sp.]|uniref:helix-turn-helix domain-containing protein n=1 Tax=uncultured Microbacterium sp. TaxID=191216 RepID=UPI0025EEA3D9|nr:hypothetical protein [uncultured Microbacterium sp.]